MTDSKLWRVEIVPFDGPDSDIEVIPCATERSAERVEDGVNINLNHEKYFTRIVGPEAKSA